MKITHVISDTNIGGAGVLLSNLISATRDFCDPSVIVPNGSSLTSLMHNRGVSVIELPMGKDKSFVPSDVGRFYSYFRKKPTDIIHTHAALSSRLGAALSGTKICISTRHCAHPDGRVKRKSRAELGIYNFCTRMTVSTADSATENLIAEGIDKNRITTIKNGVPRRTRIDTGDGIRIKESLGIPKDARLIGSCARLEAVKGQDLILRAAPMIIRMIPRIYFVFVGDGTKRGELQRLAARLGITERVRFVGFVYDPSVYQNVFHINVNSSRGTETSCLAISECMSLGIPTVASDFGGNKEMITDGINGLLFRNDNHFSLEEQLIRLLTDRRLYEALSIGAERTYESQYSVERMANEYKKLYTSLYTKIR